MKNNRFTKNLFLYFLGIFSTKIVQFLFIPIYSRYIETESFGKYNFIFSLVSLFIPLLFLSIWEGILRFVVINNEEKDTIIKSTTKFVVYLTTIYIVVFLLLTHYLGIEYGYYIILLGVSQFSVTYWQFSARALQENKIFAVSSIINAVVTILLNVVLIIFLDYGIIALFIANSLGNFIVVILIESKIKILKNIRRNKISKNIIKTLVKYSIPLSVNAVSWWLITSANNVIITTRLGNDLNGIYSLASKFGSILAIFTSILTMAWLEESFHLHKSDDKDAKFNLILDNMIGFLLGGVLVLIPITYILYKFIVFGDYYQGVNLVTFIYLSAAFSALASHLGSIFLVNNQSQRVFYTTIIGGVFSTGASFILAPYYGLMAVVITSLVGYLLMFFIRIPLLKKLIKIRINYLKLFSLTAVSILAYLISDQLKDSVLHLVIISLACTVVALIANMKFMKYVYVNYIVRKK